jgi:hydroxymethylbilane synthase
VTVRLGTRGSALALAQSRTVADAITVAAGVSVELVEVVTEGDRSTRPVPELGVGVFVSALREALLAKEIDVAVHSYKDLPTAPADGLTIAAVPARVDPRDAVVTRDGRGLRELPPLATVGTGAPRRVAQLLGLDLGLRCVPVRGNVDTRLRRVSTGELDAVVVAAAGLHRLGRLGEASEILDPALVLPAPAQGALAVECRTSDTSLVELLGRLDDPRSRAAVTAERSLLATLEAGCTAPVAALAEFSETASAGGAIYLRGAVFSADGRMAVRRSGTAPMADAAAMGARLAAELLTEGADHVLGVHE